MSRRFEICETLPRVELCSSLPTALQEMFRLLELVGV